MKAQPGKNVSSLPEMKINHDDGSWGGDITLHIQSIEKISPEVTRYKIVSGHKGSPVGFDLIVERPFKHGMFVDEGVTFKSLGDTSNNFLRALAELYGMGLPNPVFVDSITVSYADLASGTDLNKPGNWIAAQMKLFFPSDEDTYELYLNVDEEPGTISLPEKDLEYRSGILKAFTKKKPEQ